MADNINMRVSLANDSQVIASLNEINSLANQLNGKKIKLDIKANGTKDAKKDVTNYVKALEKLDDAQEQAASTAGKAAAAYGKQADELERVKTQLKNAKDAQKNYNDQISTGGGKASSMLNSVASGLLTKAVSGAASAISNAFSEAFSTMREVDGELAKIQRDSGASSEEMEKLGKSAYDTAQKYGVSATEYLKSVEMFSKSDYKGAADQLGELALRTQIAGDMSAEMASDFLLAADAAYGYEGSISQLSALVDKADSIDDKFGITMQETAAALPLISGAAAKAGMSVDETIALMGTFSESAGVTVDSAAESMSALITGIMDGTGQNVNELTELLLEYSQSARDAAEGVTEVAEPMAVIRELAESGMGAEDMETLARADNKNAGTTIVFINVPAMIGRGV